MANDPEQALGRPAGPGGVKLAVAPRWALSAGLQNQLSWVVERCLGKIGDIGMGPQWRALGIMYVQCQAIQVVPTANSKLLPGVPQAGTPGPPLCPSGPGLSSTEPPEFEPQWLLEELGGSLDVCRTLGCL